MTVRERLMRLLLQDDVNFLLTNRLPRRTLTRFMGWFSRIEHPWVSGASIKAWTFFSGADLGDAAEERYPSLHAAFTRALRPGTRPVDPAPDLLVSPCDAIVGACGQMAGTEAWQVKGAPYTLSELIGTDSEDSAFRNGSFVTLRLTAGMYHRFHAPHDLTVEAVSYIAGDAWNVNPVALKRVRKLFCRNERAVIRCALRPHGLPLLMVPVAAILVAGIRLNFLDTPGLLRTRRERNIACSVDLARGEEMGWFEHGSTIILFAPPGFALAAGIESGLPIRAGEPLLRLPRPRATNRRRGSKSS